MGHKPTFGEMITHPGALKFREPRVRMEKGKAKKDSPEGNSVSGGVLVALGTLAITFASRSMNRVRKEQRIIRRLWAENHTVGSLMVRSFASSQRLCLEIL